MHCCSNMRVTRIYEDNETCELQLSISTPQVHPFPIAREWWNNIPSRTYIASFSECSATFFKRASPGVTGTSQDYVVYTAAWNSNRVKDASGFGISNVNRRPVAVIYTSRHLHNRSRSLFSRAPTKKKPKGGNEGAAPRSSYPSGQRNASPEWSMVATFFACF